MSWRSAITLAAKGLGRRPGRAVLTVLAVLLASALLTALLSIATTAETRVLDELAKGGPLAGIKVAPAAPDPDQVNQDDARGGTPRDLDDAAVERIRGLRGIREVVPITVARTVVVSTTPTRSGKALEPYLENVVGVDITSVPTLPITVLNGRLPAPGSLRQVAVTERYLERLGIPRAEGATVLGTTVELGAPRNVGGGDGPGDRRGTLDPRWSKAEIVGIVAQEAADAGMLAPRELVQAARAWTASGVDDPRIGADTSPYAGLYVVADTLDEVGAVRQQITAVGYSTSAPENLIASVRRYLHVVEIVLTAVGAIALTVAALGITNAMLAAVRERRREIGVIKAIGGRDRDVRRIFLVEAGTLGFAGGLLGAVVGLVVAQGVGTIVNGYLIDQGLRAVELTLPFSTMGGTVVGATFLALLAGTLPAVRAARLPAREAVGAI